MARQFYGRYKVARQKAALRNNTRVIKNFEQDALAMVKDASVASLQQLAPLLLEQAINEAGFSDYTGVLINSYMVGLMINGQFVNTVNVSRNATRHISTEKTFWNSYGMPGTIRIKKGKLYARKHKRTYMKMHYMRPENLPRRPGTKYRYMIQNRNRRNLKSTEFMTFNQEQFDPRGFGWNKSRLKGMRSGNIHTGVELVLTNGAPYAQQVHLFNEGSKVFPTNMRHVSFVTITRKQLERAIIAHRINQKYGSKGGSRLTPTSYMPPIY